MDHFFYWIYWKKNMCSPYDSLAWSQIPFNACTVHRFHSLGFSIYLFWISLKVALAKNTSRQIAVRILKISLKIEEGGNFLKKLWCCVGGGNKVIWLYQLSWKYKLATVTSYKADVSSVIRQSGWRRSNARNVKFITRYGGQCTFSTKLI